MAHAKSYPLVEVTWVDSCTSGRWKPIEEYTRDSKLVECRSVGYLLQKTNRIVQIIQSLDEYGKGSDEVIIPRSTVKRIRRLR